VAARRSQEYAMKGIRLRLTAIFMIVIICTVAILEILLIYIVRQNYYNSLEGSLRNQIRICSDMYSKYYGDTSLQDNVLYNVDTFWNQSNAEVQIADQKGNIIMDSQGVISTGTSGTDIQEALHDRCQSPQIRRSDRRCPALCHFFKRR
jgi:hypothetical protein